MGQCRMPQTLSCSKLLMMLLTPAHSCHKFSRSLCQLPPLEILHTNKILPHLHLRWGVSGSCCYRNLLPSPGSHCSSRRTDPKQFPQPQWHGTTRDALLNPALLPLVPLQWVQGLHGYPLLLLQALPTLLTIQSLQPHAHHPFPKTCDHQLLEVGFNTQSPSLCKTQRTSV